MGGFVSREQVKPNLRKIREANDAVTKYRLLDARRQLVVDAGRQRPLLRLMDKRMQYLGTVALERSAEYERLMDDSGVGTISLRWSDWLADLCAHKTRVEEDLHLLIDPNPNQRSWRTRLGYRVTDVRAVKHEDGTRSVEVDLISLREHAKHILLGATPFSAPEFQPLKAWVWFQNLRSNLALATFINLARSYWPILSLPTSLFDPAHWLTTRVGNLSPLHWPLQVQFVNPLRDTSRMLPLAARWQDLHTISEPLMDDAGVALLDYIWLTEDTDSPHPELAALVGEQLARPTRNCVVLAFEDRSGIVGPTGTPFDGALDLIGATLDNTITEIILPIDRDGDGVTDPLFRKLLGVAPEKPSLVWRDCEYSGLISSEHKMHRGTSQTVWTGGHSPTWVGAPSGNRGGTGPRAKLTQPAHHIRHQVRAGADPDHHHRRHVPQPRPGADRVRPRRDLPRPVRRHAVRLPEGHQPQDRSVVQRLRAARGIRAGQRVRVGGVGGADVAARHPQAFPARQFHARRERRRTVVLRLRLHRRRPRPVRD